MYLQKVIIAAAVVLAPAVAVDDPEPNSPAQGWDSSRLGQRGFTVCPEPNMQEPGKRVKVDFCQNYVTSETYVKCRAFPTFNNVSPLQSSPVPSREQVKLTGLIEQGFRASRLNTCRCEQYMHSFHWYKLPKKREGLQILYR